MIWQSSAIEFSEADSFLGQLRIYRMRESDQKINPVSQSSTLQFTFMKLDALSHQSMFQLYSLFLVSSAFCITFLWRDGEVRGADEILLSV